jgi:hypothetical protein
MLENVKKKKKNLFSKKKKILTLNKKKRKKKTFKSNLHSERGGRLSWGNPVKKDGRLAGKRECRKERERERESFSPVKYGRERERCRPVETESGEGRPTGGEEGVPEGERERVSKF